MRFLATMLKETIILFSYIYLIKRNKDKVGKIVKKINQKSETLATKRIPSLSFTFVCAAQCVCRCMVAYVQRQARPALRRRPAHAVPLSIRADLDLTHARHLQLTLTIANSDARALSWLTFTYFHFRSASLETITWIILPIKANFNDGVFDRCLRYFGRRYLI